MIAETRADSDGLIKNNTIDKEMIKNIKNVPVSIVLEFDFSFIRLSKNIVIIAKRNNFKF